MCGCNYPFITEKGHSSDWNGELLNIFEKRDDCKYLFQRNTVPLKIRDHRKWPPEIMTVPFKYMAASALLKLHYSLNKFICQIYSI